MQYLFVWKSISPLSFPLFWRIILPDYLCNSNFSFSTLNMSLHSFTCMVFEENSYVIHIFILLLVEYHPPLTHTHTFPGVFLSFGFLWFEYEISRESTPNSPRVAEYYFIPSLWWCLMGLLTSKSCDLEESSWDYEPVPF